MYTLKDNPHVKIKVDALDISFEDLSKKDTILVFRGHSMVDINPQKALFNKISKVLSMHIGEQTKSDNLLISRYSKKKWMVNNYKVHLSDFKYMLWQIALKNHITCINTGKLS